MDRIGFLRGKKSPILTRNKMTNTILQVTKIDSELMDQVKDSFNHLPETDHADGKYRLRKYSVIWYNAESDGFLTKINQQVFKQSRKYNKHQGGMSRIFEEIDDEVVNGDTMLEMVNVFRRACSLGFDFKMDVHQMRIKCEGGATQISPEGWHQDGYDCIAMIGVDHHNVIGGELLLATNKTEQPFLQATLDTGTMMIVDDSYLWHNGRSIQPIDDNKPAWMDVFVFTAKKDLTQN